MKEKNQNTDINLKLNPDLNINLIRKNAENKFKKGICVDESFGQFLIYSILHKHSNYEKKMWSLYKRDKKFVMRKIKKILLEISLLDQTLTWDCLEVEKRYENKYEEKNRKSRLVS